MSEIPASNLHVVLSGRTDVDDYFRLHLGRQGRLTHSPLLVFRGDYGDGTLTIDIVRKPVELLSLRDETPVMGIWPGEWRSDYFQFTVGQYREFYDAKP